MKTKHIRSAWPIYIAAAAFALVALVAAMYTIGAILLGAVVCAAAYILTEKFVFKGRDIEVETETKVDTGNKTIDKQVEEGREQLRTLKALKCGDPMIDEPIDRMYTAGMRIFEAVARKPEKAQQVRKFMNYYLPTATKLMEHYRTLRNVGGSGEHVQKALNDARNSMSMVADAFEKQLDNLYRAEAMDVSSDIDVMEAMIAADGLTDDGIRSIMKEVKKQ